MTPEKTTEQAVNEKVGIGAYLSLAFAVVFFSGLCASSQWWGVFDFTTVNGGFGRLVSGVTEQGDAIKTAMANFRGKGGSGAIDGFMFALSLVPTVMFALAMITVFEHYGALKAARKILTPVLRPLIGIPGSAALALIASMQSTDGGAARRAHGIRDQHVRRVPDDGRRTDHELLLLRRRTLHARRCRRHARRSGQPGPVPRRHPARQGSLRQHDAPPPDPRLPHVTTNVKNRRRNKNVRT